MKNRKLLISILTGVFACFMSATLFTACGEKEPPHTHIYDQQVVNNTFKVSEATCEDKAEYYYSCACGEKGTETFENGSALGHSYGDWISIGSNQHQKTCLNDNSHIITESCFGGTATCTEKAVCEVCGAKHGTALQHDFGTPTYTWNNNQCTATRVCAHDNAHVETETVTGTYIKDTDATCTTAEKGHYEATFTNSAFSAQATTINSVENGKELGHSFTNYEYNDDAKCEIDGTETAVCDHNCGESDTRTKTGTALMHEYEDWKSNGNGTHTRACRNDYTHKETKECNGGTATCQAKAICSVCDTVYGNLGEHSPKTTWVITDTHHYYECSTLGCTEKLSHGEHSFTNYVSDKNATYESDGTKTATCNGGCGKTHTVTDIGSMLIKDEIQFTTLLVDGKNVYGKVSNATTEFVFYEEIFVSGNATYVVDDDKSCSSPIDSKTVDLEEGDNTFYVLETVGNNVKLYAVTIHRRYMYDVTFNTNGGTLVEKQVVEEDGYAIEPTTTKTGYQNTWDYDFSTPITESITISANWTPNTDTSYTVEYYLQDVDGNYPTMPNETYSDVGVTDTTATADEKMFTHFTYDKIASTASGNIAGNGLLVLKLYYTRDSYTVATNGNNTKAGTYTQINNEYCYEKKITLTVTTNAGYTFLGWFDGTTCVSAGEEFTYNVEKEVTLVATWEIEVHDCAFTNYVSNGNATCLEDGTETAECNHIVCNNTDTRTEEGSALGHDYTEYIAEKTPATCTSNRVNVYKCERCEETEDREIVDSATGHSYTNYASNGDATCLEDGTETAECVNGCGTIDTRTEKGSALGHDYTEYIAEKTPATCTSNRVNVYKCERCEETEDREIVDSATGHSYTNYASNGDATCLEDGTETAECDNGCGTLDTRTEEGSVLGHDYIPHEAQEETCLAIGWDTYNTCSRCNYNEYVEIPALGHNYISHEAQKETCLAIGWDAYNTCSRCDYNEYVEIPALGHDYIHHEEQEETCLEIGWNEYDTCSRCSYTTYVEIPISNTHNVQNGYCVECNIPESTAGLKYSQNSDGTYTVTGIGTCSATNIVIGLYNNKAVTTIGHSAFYNCSSLTSVVIGDGVTLIDSYAFCNCSSLTNVVIGDSVRGINIRAFSNCSKIKSIVIPNSVTLINASAFQGCNSLESLTIPFVGASLTGKNPNGGDASNFGYIFGASNYYVNSDYVPTSLKTVVITGGKTIAHSAFYGCSSLQNLTIPFVGAKADVTSSDTNSVPFGYIFGTSSYTGSKATEQCYYDYYGSTKTTTFYIPTALKKVAIIGGHIPYGAFYNCSGLTSVEVGASVTSIGNSAFYNCSGLTSVVIGNSVTTIGNAAFYNCSRLTSITIPDSVTSIDSYAFASCDNLTRVYITDIAAWCNISFRDAYAHPLRWVKNLYVNNKLVTELVIPNTVIQIKSHAFYNFSSLTSITIPDSVTSIGDYAFSGCSSLTSITIPDSVTSIGKYAFDDCSGLTIYCETTSDPSGWSAEWNSLVVNATGFRLPVVWDCKNNEVANDGYIHIVIGGIHYGIKDNFAIVVRQTGSILTANIPESITYKGTDYSITSIAAYAFHYCRSLTSITIPDSVTSIGNYAFDYCRSLTSVVIGDSVTSIGNYAFSGCSSLTSITFKDTSTWYRTSNYTNWQNQTGGTQTIVTYASTNATYFTSTYKNYYWYKL